MGNYGLGDLCSSVIDIEDNVVILYVNYEIIMRISIQGGMDRH